MQTTLYLRFENASEIGRLRIDYTPGNYVDLPWILVLYSQRFRAPPFSSYHKVLPWNNLRTHMVIGNVAYNLHIWNQAQSAKYLSTWTNR
jgi:hypothetical protein